MRPAIIIIAYNRARPLERLLSSLDRAFYPLGEDIPLIISIDKSENEDVPGVAGSFEWKHGDKRVIRREERMGLKAHVLACSALAGEYGSAIILEDDLYVSRDFYYYTVSALEFSAQYDSIAGVSLYSHRLNVHARAPFEPLNDGSDGWYFMFASSWGQAYTAAQWERFEKWFERYDGTPFPESVPENVRKWGESSWLKYFIRYCVEEKRLFLYPALSRTTNFSDEGTHRMGEASELQVPLSCAPEGSGYRFTPPDESVCVYDAYFENIRIKGPGGATVTADLYGIRPLPGDGGYFLSSQALPYRRIMNYGRSLRPMDANIFEDVEGDDFFLYDMAVTDVPPDTDDTGRLFYDYRAFKVRYGWDMAVRRLLERFVRK